MTINLFDNPLNNIKKNKLNIDTCLVKSHKKNKKQNKYVNYLNELKTKKKKKY